MSNIKQKKWFILWGLQILTMSLLSVGIALSLMTGVFYAVAMWIIGPVLAMVSAYRTTGRGLNNYLSWIAPPVCLATIHTLIWTYLPSPGPILLAALTAVVGAAAGEVKKEKKNGEKR